MHKFSQFEGNMGGAKPVHLLDHNQNISIKYNLQNKFFSFYQVLIKRGLPSFILLLCHHRS